MSQSPPPARERLLINKDQAGDSYAEFPFAWLKYFSGLSNSISAVTGTTATDASILWATVSKTGSNLTDLETRRHDSLQAINTDTYTHLGIDTFTDLTDGGDSSLHYHDTDRMQARIIASLRM